MPHHFFALASRTGNKPGGRREEQKVSHILHIKRTSGSEIGKMQFLFEN